MTFVARWSLLLPIAAMLVPAARGCAQGLGDTPEPFDRLGSELARGDFNGDGIADLAIGVPGESVTVVTFPLGHTTYQGAGAVHVLFGSLAAGTPPSGSPTGLSTNGDMFLRQPPSTATVPGIGNGNAFGSALAVGDFDGDGFDDLAIGVPGQTIGGLTGAGAVVIAYGSGRFRSMQTWSQDSPGIVDAAEKGDAFGSALAAGDFDGDGFDDLAIGVPLEDLGRAIDAGMVHVLRGSGAGLTSAGSLAWAQGAGGLPDVIESRDAFGLALAAGDLNGDGFADLAIGVPLETIANAQDGAVHVLYGNHGGLASAGTQLWHQDSPGIAGIAEQDDNFGAALTIADFDGDGFGDLAIGVPQEATNGLRGGGVHVLFGGLTGVTAVSSLLITQDTGIVIDEVEDGDRFGARLSTWRLDAASPPLLTVGVPGESQGNVTGAGGLEGLGLSKTGVGYCLMLAFPYAPAQPNDGVGSAIASGDFNGDGTDDIAVGIPGRDVSGVIDSGMVYVTYPRFWLADLWRQGQ